MNGGGSCIIVNAEMSRLQLVSYTAGASVHEGTETGLLDYVEAHE
jgi:hypothetical protein